MAREARTGGPESYHLNLYWLDRNEVAEPLEVPSAAYGDARFSPDGQRLAITILACLTI